MADTAPEFAVEPRTLPAWPKDTLRIAIFSGATMWLLADPTSAGMHAATATFSAPGTDQYLCLVPGHAADGMAEAFVVAD